MLEKIPDIGSFDRSFSIKLKVRTTDSYGQPVVTLDTSDFTRGCCNMVPYSNDERYSSDRETVFSSFKVQMYYKAGLTNDMILYLRDTLEAYDIKSVQVLGRKQFIELIVEKLETVPPDYTTTAAPTTTGATTTAGTTTAAATTTAGPTTTGAATTTAVPTTTWW